MRRRTWRAPRRRRASTFAVTAMVAAVLVLVVLARHRPGAAAQPPVLLAHPRAAVAFVLVCAVLIVAGRAWLRRQRALRLGELTAWRQACRQAEYGGYELPPKPRTKTQQVAVSPWGRTWFAVLPLVLVRLTWDHLPAGLPRLLLIGVLIVAPGIWVCAVEAAQRWWAVGSIAGAYLLLWVPITDRGAVLILLLVGLGAGEARRRWFNREPEPAPEPEPEPEIEIPLTPAAIWDDKFGAPGRPLAGSLLLDVQPIIRKSAEEDWA